MAIRCSRWYYYCSSESRLQTFLVDCLWKDFCYSFSSLLPVSCEVNIVTSVVNGKCGWRSHCPGASEPGRWVLKAGQDPLSPFPSRSGVSVMCIRSPPHVSLELLTLGIAVSMALWLPSWCLLTSQSRHGLECVSTLGYPRSRGACLSPAPGLRCLTRQNTASHLNSHWGPNHSFLKDRTILVRCILFQNWNLSFCPFCRFFAFSGASLNRVGGPCCLTAPPSQKVLTLYHICVWRNPPFTTEYWWLSLPHIC